MADEYGFFLRKLGLCLFSKRDKILLRHMPLRFLCYFTIRRSRFDFSQRADSIGGWDGCPAYF